MQFLNDPRPWWGNLRGRPLDVADLIAAGTLTTEAAARFSDVVIVTSDNPRSEDPLDIIAEIEPGLATIGKPYLKIPDRREDAPVPAPIVHSPR